MTPKKIIPCLDCKAEQGEWRVVKGIKFENLRLAGDPVELAKKYSEQGADEITMLDITASQEERKPFFDLVKQVSEVIQIPLIVGGGISSISDIEKLLESGAAKVSLNTAVVRNPEFLSQAVEKFGSEKIIVAVDVHSHTKRGQGAEGAKIGEASPRYGVGVKKQNEHWKVCILGGTKETDLDAIEWAKEVESRGAGALLPTSKDKDGTKQGYDVEILKKLKEAVSIPIIASGGAGKKEDFLEALIKGKADAVLAAGIFHFGELEIPELKKYLKENGVNVN